MTTRGLGTRITQVPGPQVMRAILVLLAIQLVAPAAAEAEAALRPGRYRVDVVLEMPHVLRAMPYGTVERCIAEDEAAGGFARIESSPAITACPIVGRRWEGNRLSQSWACGTANTGMAKAGYTISGEGFVGRIAVTMGGKNMTLSEVQTGRRIGDCP